MVLRIRAPETGQRTAMPKTGPKVPAEHSGRWIGAVGGNSVGVVQRLVLGRDVGIASGGGVGHRGDLGG